MSLAVSKNGVLVEADSVVGNVVSGFVGASVFCPGDFDGNIEPFF